MNDAWSDDAEISVRHGALDPDSRALLDGLKRIFWPGWIGLAVFALIVFVFDLDGLRAVLTFAAGAWGCAHLCFRPKQTLALLWATWGKARQTFAAAGKGLANLLAPAIARLNAAYHTARRARERARAPAAPQGLAASVEVVENPEALTRDEWWAAPRPSILGTLRAHWGAIAIGCVALLLFLGWNPFGFFGRSADEVASDFEANVAESRTATAEAETDLAREIGDNSIERVQFDHRIELDLEQTRAQIRDAVDLEARLIVHSDFGERLRDESADAFAAAVSDYTASVGS